MLLRQDDQKQIYCILRKLHSAVVDGQPIYELRIIQQSRILIALTGNTIIGIRYTPTLVL